MNQNQQLPSEKATDEPQELTLGQPLSDFLMQLEDYHPTVIIYSVYVLLIVS